MAAVVNVVRAAGMLVYRISNNTIEYLLLQASYPPFHWTPPKGHLDPGEDELTAALRETKEEAGIDKDKLEVHKDFDIVLQYQVKQSSRYSQEVTKDKTVKYWLAKLNDSNAVKLSEEHKAMKWAPLEEAIKISKFPEMERLFRSAEKYLKSN